MMKIAVLCVLVSVACAAYQPYGYRPAKIIKVVEKAPEPAPAPIPYEFSYDITDDDGNKQGRTESGDGAGNKKGGYSIQLADGRKRWVEYVADGEGFRAVITTNEQGTDDQDPANVDLTVDGPLDAPTPAPKKELKYKVIKVPVGGYGYH